MTKNHSVFCLCLLVLLMGTGLGSAAPLFEATMGVNHHFSLNPAQDAKDIADTASAGFRLIRFDMIWESVEKTKGVYDFQAFDRLVNQMVAKGIRPLFILDYGNPLYGGAPVRSAEARSAFAKFAATAAARYKGKGIVWEIWNEPNHPQFWSAKPNVFEYMKLVIEAATAIRAEDPNAYIIAPAVSGIDFSFLAGCIKLGLLRQVDAVSVHPYRDDQPEMALAELVKLQYLIAEHSPQKSVPVVVSEWGYSLLHPGVTEEVQARYLQRLFLVTAMAGVEFTVWYDFRNDGPDPRNFEHNFGLYRHDGREKPVLAAARSLAQQLTGRRFLRRLISRQDDYILEFVDANAKSCVVAWTTGAEHVAAVPGFGAMTLTQNPQFIGCR